MSSFSVTTPALAAGALSLSGASNSCLAAEARISCSAIGDCFGGESMGATVQAAMGRAVTASGGLGDVLAQLSTNVEAAGLGYLTTDRGLMPTWAIGAARPGAHA